MTEQLRDFTAASSVSRPRVPASTCDHVRYRVVTDNVGTIISTLPNRHCPNCGTRLTPPTIASFDEDRALFERLLRDPPDES